MAAQVQQVVAACESCQQWTQLRPGYSPLRPIFARAPWSDISIDLNTAMTKSAEGFQYVLMVVCTFSQFVILRPLKSKRADEIAPILFQLFCDFGPSHTLRSDSGGEFLNSLVRHIIDAFGVQHDRIASYNPRVMGRVERVSGVMSTAVKKIVHETGVDWPQALPFAQLCLNGKTRYLTGASPFSLVFNREVQRWQSFPLLDYEKPVAADLESWVVEQRRLWQEVFPAVSLRASRVQLKQASDFNEQHFIRNETLPVGARVMVLDHNRLSKSEPPYVGPFQVVRFSRNAYTLMDDAGGIYPHDVPINQLKPVQVSKPREAPAAQPQPQPDADVYYVDRIVDHRVKNGKYEYKVVWSGFDESDSTWEPFKNIIDKSSIQRYMASLDKLPRSRKVAATAASRPKRKR